MPITMYKLRNILILLIVLTITRIECKVSIQNPLTTYDKNIAVDSPVAESKQLFLGAQGKETSTPNFVRLVVMRLIYGIASTMGLEERLDGVFNGVFVPPNADGDIFGLGGLGGGDDDDDGLSIFNDY